MPQIWEVLGGETTGGIVVRAGKALSSAAENDRLSTGACVAEDELDGNRLRYTRLTGNGPRTGWVTVSLKDKVLVSRAERLQEDFAFVKGCHAQWTDMMVMHKDGHFTRYSTDDSGRWTARNSVLVLAWKERPVEELQASSGACTFSGPSGFSITSDSVPAWWRAQFNKEQSAALQPHPAAPGAQHLRILTESLDDLERHARVLLRVRSAIEAGSASSVQYSRLHEVQDQLVRALMKTKAAADELDPPSTATPRMQLRCASPSCPFLVHSRESIGGFCCPSCHKFGQTKRPLALTAAATYGYSLQKRPGYTSGAFPHGRADDARWRRADGRSSRPMLDRPYRMALPNEYIDPHRGAAPTDGERHDVRCERRRALAGAKLGSRESKPIDDQQLAEIELEEAIRVCKAHRLKQKTGLENTWLESNPKWSESGTSAVGTWASSIVHDEWGDPDTNGPKQLLQGGVWISRKGHTVDQWLVFDLGTPQFVSEVRLRGNHSGTRSNPKSMHWQAGDGIDGTWRTVESFSGTQDSNWVQRAIDPPVKSRWWRLLISSNYGDKAYVWICGFGIRQVWRPDCERHFEKEAKVAKDDENKETREAKPEKVAKVEKEPGSAHKRMTNSELRSMDSTWQSPAGFFKLLIHGLLSDRLLYFEDKLYIDYRRQRPEDYAQAFLQQTTDQGWSLDYDPNFFCELAYEGFNPISIEIPSDNDLMIQVLSLCFEPGRHVVDCLDVHISKNVRKRAKNYSITIDTAYDDVMLGCIQQHGEAWLYRGQRWLHRKLLREGYTGKKDICFSMHSIELWGESGQLVAGDLGYIVGGVYVSQTGFHQDGTTGAGEVQLVLAAALLYKMGHSWFDLGQANPYKAALGAELLDRYAWLERFRASRDQRCRFSHERIGGQQLLSHLLRGMADRERACKEGPAPGLHLLESNSAVFIADTSWGPGAAWEHCLNCTSNTGIQHFVLHHTSSGQAKDAASTAKGMRYLLTLPRLTELTKTCKSGETGSKLQLPLIVHFHGSIDPTHNQKEVPVSTHVKKVFDETQFSRAAAHAGGNAFIGLAPLCPVEVKDKRKMYWFKSCDASAYEEWDLSGATRCRELELMVLEVLARVCTELPVDASRIYFMGSSVGGYAALRLAEFLPHLPAAVATMSAYYPEMPEEDHSTTTLAERLQGIPRVWLLHCKSDTTVPVDLRHVSKLHRQLRDRCNAEVEWVPAVVALAPEGDFHSSHRRIYVDPEAFYRELLQNTREDLQDAAAYVSQKLARWGRASEE